jgi:hypothetical protein
MPIKPALRNLRQEDHELEGQPGLHSETLSLKKKKRTGVMQGHANFFVHFLSGQHTLVDAVRYEDK